MPGLNRSARRRVALRRQNRADWLRLPPPRPGVPDRRLHVHHPRAPQTEVGCGCGKRARIPGVRRARRTRRAWVGGGWSGCGREAAGFA